MSITHKYMHDTLHICSYIVFVELTLFPSWTPHCNTGRCWTGMPSQRGTSLGMGSGDSPYHTHTLPTAKQSEKSLQAPSFTHSSTAVSHAYSAELPIATALSLIKTPLKLNSILSQYTILPDFNVLQNSGKLHWFILSLHGSRVKTISTILELHYKSLWVTYCQVILGTEVLQRLQRIYSMSGVWVNGEDGGPTFTSLLCMYPVSAVFTAVSTKPVREITSPQYVGFTLQCYNLLSLQPCGRKTRWEWVQSRNYSWQTLLLQVPWLNDNHRDRWNNLLAKTAPWTVVQPQLNVSIHFFGKWGRALSSNPSGILFPLMACWPTHAIICEILMKDPLEPQRAMVRGLLVWWSSCLHDFPADSLITDSSWRTTDYRSSIGNHYKLYKQISFKAHILIFSYSHSAGIISRASLLWPPKSPLQCSQVVTAACPPGSSW